MTSLTMKQHLRERYCTPEIYGNSIVIDDAERVITFLLWNLSGQLVGYQQYRPDNHEKAVKNHPDKRYYLYVGEEGELYNKSKKKMAIFGLETIKKFSFGPIILTEGIFDAVRLHSRGYCALALLTSNPTKIRSFLKTIHRIKISACDGDPAGRSLAKYGDYSIHLPDGKDVGDLDKDEFNMLLNQINKIEQYAKYPNDKSGTVLPRSAKLGGEEYDLSRCHNDD